jgi:hypothetical protein
LAVIRTRRAFLRVVLKVTIRSLDLDVMARNFYFGADATMVSGSALFSAMINADASAFGLSDAQALAYGEIDAALQSAYQAWTNPSTRTPIARAHKDAIMKSMQRMASDLSAIIHATPTVTDAQLTSLGLLPRPRRKRRNVPDIPPRVQVISVRGRVVKIRVCDRHSVSGRSKPFGARGANVFSYVGEESPADPHAYHYECFASRTTTQITFPDKVPSGATVWLSARWLSARGETSIASAPISFTLTGGAISAAAPKALRAAA